MTNNQFTGTRVDRDGRVRFSRVVLPDGSNRFAIEGVEVSRLVYRVLLWAFGGKA